MKVKIVKASQPSYWYANRIGETFEVEDISGYRSYTVINNPKFTNHCIDKCDCEIISETVKIPFTFEAWDKDRSQKVWTRDGREVTQLTWFNCNSIVPLVGVVENDVMRWGVNGLWGSSVSRGSSVSKFDLFLEHTEKEYFVNVYEGKEGIIIGGISYSEIEAKQTCMPGNKLIKTISFKA